MKISSTIKRKLNILEAVKFMAVLLGMGMVAWYFSGIFLYIVVSLILASILKAPTNYLSQRQLYGIRIPRSLSIMIAFVGFFGLVSLFVYLFVPLVSAQVKVILSVDFEALANSMMIPVEALEDMLMSYKVLNGPEGVIKERIKETLTGIILGENSRQEITGFVNSILSLTGNFFVALLAVLFITFFFLYEKGTIRKYFISLIPNKYFEMSISALSKTEKLLANYLLGLLLQMIAIFSIVSFGLLIMGVDYAVTIALFAAVANLIPFVGPVLGAIFGLFVGLSTNAGLEIPQDYFILIMKILTVFAVLQLTDNIFLQPIIFSKSVKAHPLEIFLIVFVGANLGGAVGMIAAIPSYTIMKVTFTEFLKGYRQYQVFRN